MKYKSKIIIIFKSLCTLRGNFIYKNNIIKKLVNWSILVTKKKENKNDFISSGERK